MEHGQPDPKRRMISGPDPFLNGRLPPPPLHHSHQHQSPQHQYPPPVSYPRPPQIDSRRQHESEYSSMPPVHDPHRGTSSAPTQFNAYREPAIKRDPSLEPSIAQHTRPSSTGHNEGPRISPPHHEDPRRQSMPGYEQSPAPPQYRPGVPVHHAYPPPHLSVAPPPQPPPPQYDHPYGHPPTPGGMRDQGWGNAPQTAQNAAVRKKAPRTSQACGQCRAAKAKCDDPKPCTTCTKQGLNCDFKPPEPKPTDKIQADILSELKSLSARQANMENIFRKIAPQLKFELKREDPKEEDLDGTIFDHLPRQASDAQTSSAQTVGFSYNGQGQSPDDESHDDPDEEGERQPFPNTEPAIPVNHTTPAARLLLWSGIAQYVQDFMTKSKIRNSLYPLNAEIKRGVLRLYGRGESSAHSHSFIEREIAYESTDQDMDDGSSDASASPAADATLWGSTAGYTPPVVMTRSSSSERRGGPSNASYGTLTLDEDNIRHLTRLYMVKLNQLHPIIFPKRMENLIKDFLKSMPDSKTGSAGQAPVTAPAFVGIGNNIGASKRKFSSTEPPEQTFEATVVSKTAKPQRSINTALLFMVLALGKICEHKDRIPDIVKDQEPLRNNVIPNRNGYTSPGQLSPGISPQSLPSQSPVDSEGRPGGRRGSLGHSSIPRHSIPLRNADVIPGLAYFAEATNIIGNQLGGNTLTHVHANILACLYQGQLARVVESHAYIANANRALRILLKPKFDALREQKKNYIIPRKEHNPLLVAFWTCLQLESDILAELDLPKSEVLDWAEYIPFPNVTALAENVDEIKAKSYMAQLMLRQHLNEIHRKIYSWPEDIWNLNLSSEHEAYKACRDFTKIMPQIHRIAGYEWTWKEEDPPSADILHARLRAKYYGASMITYRPFLKMVLDRQKLISDSSVSYSRYESTGGVPPEILDFAKRCMDSLEKSTSSFLGMRPEGRLIVTNVWGTAHAQWGNVIVLLACWCDQLLRPFIPLDRLREHVRNIVLFLGSIAKESSALQIDLRILRHMAVSTSVFDGREHLDSYVSSSAGVSGPGSSFSSNA